MERISLEETELFRGIDEARVAHLQFYLQVQPFSPGDHLYYASEPAEHLWLVRAGGVRTIKTSSNGRVTTLERLRPGDLFGMAVLIEGSNYAESAQGIVAGEAWRCPRDFLSTLIKGEPELGPALVAIVAKRLQSANERLCSFAYDSVPSRIARAVLDQADGDRIEMTRRDLGESVGTTVETTIRVLRAFERVGWIETGVGWVRVVDGAALQGVARGEDPPS